VLALPGSWAGPALAAGRPGERITLRFSYLGLTAGQGTLRVLPGARAGRDVLHFVTEARSQGFFAWLLRYQVDDRTDAWFDPAAGCSLGIEKRLREGRAVRDQTVAFDWATGTARVADRKLERESFEVGSCPLDVLSALQVMRLRGVPAEAPLELEVFDNGKRYLLRFLRLGRERLDLPAPLGPATPTLVIEPLLAEGTGLFVKTGRLKLWITDDERRVPVRLRTKVPIGSVSADLVVYEP
jgi:hypothetical protein